MVEPITIEWDGKGSAQAYVIAKNINRRHHLSESQKGMAVAELATLEHGANQYRGEDGPIGPSTLSTDEAAKLAGVGTTTIKRAKAVLRYGTPEEIEACGGTSGGLGRWRRSRPSRNSDKVGRTKKQIPKFRYLPLPPWGRQRRRRRKTA